MPTNRPRNQPWSSQFLFLWSLTLLVLPGVGSAATVTGIVVDESGEPVFGALISDYWIAGSGCLEGGTACSDKAGRFSLDVPFYQDSSGVMAVDSSQQRGAMVCVSKTDAEEPLHLQLQPLIRVRADFFCRELNEAPAWCNTYVLLPTNSVRVMGCSSFDAELDLKLPPGEYKLNCYDSTEMEGTNLVVVLIKGQSALDLGRLQFAATPIGRAAGRPSPAWHITEARGMPGDAGVGSFRGKWLLLDFWGYWCGPCVRAMPDLFDLYDRHAKDRDAFEIVAIHRGAANLEAMDRELKGTVSGLWNGRDLPFPVIVDSGTTTFDNFGVRFYPTQILIDPDGRIVRGGGDSVLEAVLNSRNESGVPVAISEDCEWVARGTQDGTVRVHASGAVEPMTIRIGSNAVNCVAFSPTGDRIATGARDGCVAVRAFRTGQEAVLLEGHQGPVFALAFSPDGRWLVSAGFDTTRLWDLETQGEVEEIGRRLFPAWSVAFSKDGRTIAAGGCGTILVRNVPTGEEVATFLQRSPGLIRALDFSPDGRMVASAGDRLVSLWSLPQGRNLWSCEPLGSDVCHVRFAGDGESLTALTRGRILRSFKASDGTRIKEADPGCERMSDLFADELADDARALAGEAWLAALESDWGGANGDVVLAQARQALALEPTNGAAQRALGAVLYRKGAFRDAVAVLERDAGPLDAEDSHSPDPPAARVFLVLALQQEGEVARADAELFRVWNADWNPGSREAGIFEEALAMRFGPGSDVARSYLIERLRAGMTPEQLLATLERSDLGAAEQHAVRGMLPLASAYRQVESLQARIGLRDRVVQAVEASEVIAPEWRPAALTMAQETVENAGQLNGASWEVVSAPNRSSADYELALAQAEAAYGLSAEEAIRNTLGVALYRAGHFDEAVAILIQSEERNPAGIADANDLPFLAMAFDKLGKSEEAIKRYDQLRSLLSEQAQPSQETLGFLHEAEAELGIQPVSQPPPASERVSTVQ